MPFNNKRNSRDDNSKKNRSNSESFKSKGGQSRQHSSSSDRKPFGKNSPGRSRSDRSDSTQNEHPFGRFEKSDRKPFQKRDDNRSFQKSDDRRSFNRSDRDDNRGERKSFDKPFNRSGRDDNRGERKSFDKPFNRSGRDDNRGERKSFDKPFNRSGRDDNRGERKSFDKPFNRSGRDDNREERSFDKSDYRGSKRNFSRDDEGSNGEDGKRFYPRKKIATAEPKDDGLIRLNRYISNSGICSRRKADELIESGVVTVNGEAVTELGTKVDPAKDEIRYNGERLKREKMVYILLNKPKDYITTTDDPQERRTVMHLVAKATKERIYPVGRLDRNTTGLLLLTNDGNLAEKLSHPRNNISKIYNVELNKNLTQGDFNKIEFGIELEDGLIKPDDLSYVQGASKREVGIQIHSGKNRIVRRIFESLGYEVVKLDRVVYANLTKKDLPRGRWRYLEDRELVQIKHLIK
ncbi:pseudouridine synthase [Sphingobacterium psychroaquaticum]|uniref:Pseudouridine synthase n=1 Tax=Sphingobacterium psychroaquaticum TaxID=561061 RepID=A0A1X7I022_9SPHI|nr:pseudouridine synthase [Sphingobacterium psychroaquaticum]SMG07506.1 23S rRNA pseudouridine2605 synthase [Sphingobacterium psychroaquaticum]